MANVSVNFQVKKGLPVVAKRVTEAFKRMAVKVAKI